MRKINVLFVVALSCFASLALAGESAHGHWDYSGAEGPEHWGSLDPAFSACSSGKNQSPIDLKDFVKADLKPISFAYKTGGKDIVNNGHTVQVNYPDGGGIEIEGHAYTLKQFHFHAPSENEINGRTFPMEAHFVHADAAGKLTVVAVFFEEGAANSALTNIFAHMPKTKGQEKALAFPLAAETLMPANKEYYRFDGSLTTPPCTEGVQWLVMKTPVTASPAQIDQLKSALHHPNNRPVQPLNGRTVAQ